MSALSCQPRSRRHEYGCLLTVTHRAYDVLAASQNDVSAVAGQGNNTVSAVDISTGLITGAPIPVGFCTNALAISLDGAEVYALNASAATVLVIDAATGKATVTGNS